MLQLRATLLLVIGLGCSPTVADEGTTTGGDTITSTDDSAETSTATSSVSTGDASDSGGSSSGGVVLSPFEQAAHAACERYGSITPAQIPSGEGAFLDNGFRIGNELPQRFVMDGASPDANAWPPDFNCYDVHPPQDFDGEWWFADGWLEDDGQIHVYMATTGIDRVVYYGSSESGPDVPGNPLTESVEFDASDICPTLPRIWIPDIAGFPDNAGRICTHHTTAIAEAMFVRVP